MVVYVEGGSESWWLFKVIILRIEGCIRAIIIRYEDSSESGFEALEECLTDSGNTVSA